MNMGQRASRILTNEAAEHRTCRVSKVVVKDSLDELVSVFTRRPAQRVRQPLVLGTKKLIKPWSQLIGGRPTRGIRENGHHHCTNLGVLLLRCVARR